MVTVILDTNIWISGIFFKGKLNTIMQVWKNGEFAVGFSQETFTELQEKLHFFGEKFQKEIIVKQYLSLIRKRARFVYPKKHFHLCEDLSDNKFFDVAYEVKADYIVSGDIMVQKVKKIEQTSILSPKHFLEILILHLAIH